MHDYKFHGYWGLIDASSRFEWSIMGELGGRGEVSCLIKSEYVDAFNQRYNIEDLEDFAETF